MRLRAAWVRVLCLLMGLWSLDFALVSFGGFGDVVGKLWTASNLIYAGLWLYCAARLSTHLESSPRVFTAILVATLVLPVLSLALNVLIGTWVVGVFGLVVGAAVTAVTYTNFMRLVAERAARST